MTSPTTGPPPSWLPRERGLDDVADDRAAVVLVARERGADDVADDRAAAVLAAP